MHIDLIKKYVVGLIFDNKDRVLLIKKLRPEEHKGQYNGVGGKVEKGETFIEAMTREAKEECGLEILDWTLYNQISFDDVQLKYYYTIIDDIEIEKFKSLTDEEVQLFEINNLPKNILKDVKRDIKFIKDCRESIK